MGTREVAGDRKEQNSCNLVSMQRAVDTGKEQEKGWDKWMVSRAAGELLAGLKVLYGQH